MNRDEQIKDFAIQCYDNIGCIGTKDMIARWSDNNPPRLYIVMRCEEHSDYVDKVFVDKNKAIAYCEQYNSNPREYSRTIEEMEVTL